MSKQTSIPTTIFVPQAPHANNVDQMDVWLRTLAGYVNGSQEIKEGDLSIGDTVVGKVRGTRTGANVNVTGEFTTLGTSSVISGIPVKSLHDSFISVYNTVDGTVMGVMILAGEKSFDTALLAVSTRYLLSGSYLADSALKK